MSDSSSSKLRWVVFAVLWLGIVGVVALSWKFFWQPRQEQAVQKAKEEEKQQVVEATSSGTRYKHDISFAIDSFSGYAIARTEEFKNELSNRGIRLNLVPDDANYVERLKALRDGKVQMGMFTIDALIKASAELGESPATIVSLTDATKGADAMVSHLKTFPNIDSLNSSDIKFVITPDSPSETLSRVVMAYFNLDQVTPNQFVKVNGAKEVFEKYRNSKPGDKMVFVLWEPYVSKMTSNQQYGVLIDTSKFNGYIIDVIVVSRDFLLKNEDVVKDVVECYFSANFAYRSKMSTLIADDAKASGEPLTPEMAKNLTEKILWKNTQENYAHFGLTTGHNYQHIEDMLANITKVLIKTGAISSDPTGGKYNVLYYDKIMRSLFDSNFHPGLGSEEVRVEKTLVQLSDEDWGKLIPVGTLQVPRLVFGRGTATLTSQSEETLAMLSQELKTWPQYYLIVRGHCSKNGDVEANRKLAAERAQAAVDWLVKNGVDKNRVKADTSEPNGSTTVAFILGQTSY